MATDIIATHGQTKKVTLLHSRPNLLNRFDIALHEAAMKRMEEFGIEVILGSRVDGSFINKTEGGKVRTTDGREVEADLIVSVESGASKFILESFSLTSIECPGTLSTALVYRSIPQHVLHPKDLPLSDQPYQQPRLRQSVPATLHPQARSRSTGSEGGWTERAEERGFRGVEREGIRNGRLRRRFWVRPALPILGSFSFADSHYITLLMSIAHSTRATPVCARY